MCITGLYGYTVCQIIIYDSVGDSNFGMGVLHVKREILTYLLWRSLSVCSIFLFFHRIEYPKRCLWKKNKKILSSSFRWYDCIFKKVMYRPCDLDLWPVKVKLIYWVEYKPMIALHKFQSDISTNSREIEDQNIEKSPSLIIARLVSMATNKNRWFDFLEKVLPLSYNWSAPTVKKSGRSDQYCGLYIVWRQTSQKKLTGQDIIWKPLREREYFSKPLRFFTVRLTLTATCQGQRLRALVYLVVIIQRNSVQCWFSFFIN